MWYVCSSTYENRFWPQLLGTSRVVWNENAIKQRTIATVLESDTVALQKNILERFIRCCLQSFPRVLYFGQQSRTNHNLKNICTR